MDDIVYDGQTIKWKGRTYRAASGLTWANYFAETRSDFRATNVFRASHSLCRAVGADCIVRYHPSDIPATAMPMKTRQHPDYQDHPNGPVPEGRWKLAVWLGEEAQDNGEGICKLEPSWRLEKIPRDDATTSSGKSCNPYRENWGSNRIRIEPADGLTKNRLVRNGRGGFYIHDSTKGFSHGCIEVDTGFFDELYRYYESGKASKPLIMRVKYRSNERTYGGTRR